MSSTEFEKKTDLDDDVEPETGVDEEDIDDGDNTEDEVDDADEVDDDDDDDDDEPEDFQSDSQNENTASIATINDEFISGEINDDVLTESDDDDYEYDEDTLKKLENNKPNINSLHPELITVNNDELINLTHVVRNKYGIIIDNLHRSIPILTKYEFTKIVGQRIKQLNSGVKPIIAGEKYINNYNIAENEVRGKKLPVIIKRPMPSGACEYWKLQDLEILN